MNPITVRHHWQDYNGEDCDAGEVGVPVQSESVTFVDVRELVSYLNDVFTVGEMQHRPETCGGGESVYYDCQWPLGWRVGDPQYRSGSVHLEPCSSHVLRAVVARCNLYVV